MAANNAPVFRTSLVQAGVEVTPGTLLAATRVVDVAPGGAEWTPLHDAIEVPQAGDLSETVAIYPGLTGIDAMVPINCSYDDLPWWLNLFATPQVSGTGGSAPYSYTQAPNATSDDVSRYSFEFGGAGTPAWPSAVACAGMAGISYELTFQKNGIWQLRVSLRGQTIAKQAITGALSARTVKHIRTLDTKVYLNGTGSAFGTTQLVTRMVEGSIKYENGGDPRQTMDGTGAPALIAMVGPQKVSGKIAVHFSSMQEFDDWLAANAQRLRIKATGPTLGAGNYTAQVDAGIEINKWKLRNDRGLWLAEIDFKGVKDTSIGSQIKHVTQNNSATLV